MEFLWESVTQWRQNRINSEFLRGLSVRLSRRWDYLQFLHPQVLPKHRVVVRKEVSSVLAEGPHSADAKRIYAVCACVIGSGRIFGQNPKLLLSWRLHKSVKLRRGDEDRTLLPCRDSIVFADYTIHYEIFKYKIYKLTYFRSEGMFWKTSQYARDIFGL